MVDDILKDPWVIFDDVDEETKEEFELSDMLVDIACKIINYRLDSGLTQKDLANKLNITQAMISKLESGEYNPSIEFLFKISKSLGWKFELTFEEEPISTSIEYNIKKEEIAEEMEELKGFAA